MQNKKKKLFIIALTLIVIIGTSLAFFIPQLMAGSESNIDLASDTTDKLIFDVDKDLSLKITQFNLTQGGNNLTDSVVASASLTANNTNNTASYNYYVYLQVENNEYTYTSEDKKAEIILTVTDPSGNPVTSIEGLTYVTQNGVSGFDVTENNGLIKIGVNHLITSESSRTPTVQNWNITLTFVNLDSDQSNNMGKSLNAKVLIQRDNLQTFAEYIKGTYGSDSTLLLHNASLANSANDGSYRYAGASASVNNYVCFGSNAETCPEDNLYRIIGVFGNNVKLIKSDYATATDLGKTADYTYTNPTSDFGGNYKGSQAQVAGYYWSGSSSNQVNNWTTSRLNTGTLNGTYLTNLGNEWSSKIATTTWKVGGNTYANIAQQNARTAYQNEIVSPAETTTYNAKIGLMYVSEYGYAASQENWTTNMNSYSSASNNNWMHMGAHEWTISRRSDHSNDVFYVYSPGYVYNSSVINSRGVRPSFSLESSVVLQSGNGTAASPYRIF